MKNRALRALAIGLALGGFVLSSAMPANAASLTWKDPAGDATDAGVGAAVLPNDPAFDVTASTITNDGGNLEWSIDIPGMPAGRPTLSTGYNIRFAFTHDGVTYWFKAAEDAAGATTIALSATATGSANSPACTAKCKLKFNREAKKVVVTIPLDALNEAIKQAGGPPVTGGSWTALYVLVQRPIGAPGAGGVTLTADRTDAPTGAKLTF